MTFLLAPGIKGLTLIFRMWVVTVNMADLSKSNKGYFRICSKNSAKIIETLVHCTPLLREKCPYLELFLSVISPTAGKYGPK